MLDLTLHSCSLNELAHDSIHLVYASLIDFTKLLAELGLELSVEDARHIGLVGPD